MRRILIAQLITALITATLFLLWQPNSALAALFGGGIALANGLLIARRIAKRNKQDAGDTEINSKTEVASMYVSVIERFVLVAVLLAIGLGYWKEMREPQLALISGFVAGQFALMIIAKTTRS